MLRLLIENILDKENKMGHWSVAKIKDFAEVKGGKRLPKGKQLIKESNSHPYIRIRDLGKTKYIQLNSEYEYVDDETQKSIARYIVNKGDILISVVGTIGLVGIVGDTLDKANQTENCDKIINIKNVLPEYLYYYLISSFGQDEIRKGIVGAVQPKLPLKNVQDISIFYPSIKEQERIVNILSSVDEKIEMNNAINNNLEQQAKAIFSNEFLTLETLPDGWKQSSLIDIADYLNGLAMQKYRPTADETGIPVLKIKELRQGCCDDNSELCSPSIKSEYIIHDGDVIFSWSGSLLVDFWCGGICGLNQHLFKVTSNKYNKWFYYAWTKHHLDRFIAVAADKATTMGHIKRDELSKAEVLIPNEADYKRVETLLQPIYDLIIANRIENKKLAETRATLLPKLMTGEIDISEVDYE